MQVAATRGVDLNPLATFIAPIRIQVSITLSQGKSLHCTGQSSIEEDIMQDVACVRESIARAAGSQPRTRGALLVVGLRWRTV
eukprot:COSAG06_NODE_2622_length_6571_cov_2.727104_1_plen_83_part_00